jgi:hypothetical protein
MGPECLKRRRKRASNASFEDAFGHMGHTYTCRIDGCLDPIEKEWTHSRRLSGETRPTWAERCTALAPMHLRLLSEPVEEANSPYEAIAKPPVTLAKENSKTALASNLGLTLKKILHFLLLTLEKKTYIFCLKTQLNLKRLQILKKQVLLDESP